MVILVVLRVILLEELVKIVVFWCVLEEVMCCGVGVVDFDVVVCVIDRMFIWDGLKVFLMMIDILVSVIGLCYYVVFVVVDWLLSFEEMLRVFDFDVCWV